MTWSGIRRECIFWGKFAVVEDVDRPVFTPHHVDSGQACS